MIIRVLLPKDSTVMSRGHFQKGFKNALYSDIVEQDYISNGACHLDIVIPDSAVLEVYPRGTKLEECPPRAPEYLPSP
jgi:hypothetical protein